MELQKTSKDILTVPDILKLIQDYERNVVPSLDTFWNYYRAKNEKILNRKTPDPNNPDHRLVVSYGRKIIKTFTGYGYRPRYITYKANTESDVNKETGELEEQTNSVEEQFMKELQDLFDKNNEHIKTSRNGRNTGIFGVAYELMYMDGVITTDRVLPIKAEVKFFNVDPREMILLYDFSPEPKVKMAIRFFKTEDLNKYMVEVYYKDRVETYSRMRIGNDRDWILTFTGTKPHFFTEVPVVAYYLGDEMQSIIEPVMSLIDAFDVLFSDSMNEFDRFAFAYLIMKKFGLTDPTTKKDPTKADWALKLLKRRRVIENMPADADIKFLTKDIPIGFIQWMATTLKEQIHIQSHVPDFNSTQMTSGISGIAIQRLMFDFENLVSSAEADFDVGLLRRIELIAGVLAKLNRPTGTPDMILINHKRNTPVNLMEFAQTSATMKQAGLSRYVIADIWPDDVIPNVEEELAREDADAAALMPDMSQYDMGGSNPPEDLTQYDVDGNAITDENGNPIEEE